jgi:thioredoxin 1
VVHALSRAKVFLDEDTGIALASVKDEGKELHLPVCSADFQRWLMRSGGEVVRTSAVKEAVANIAVRYAKSTVPVLVDFWSPNCDPCRRLAPILDELAAEAGGRFRVGKVNAWEEQGLAVRYRISAVPTLLVFKGGAVVNSMVGYQDKRRLLEALKAALDGHAA